MLFVTLHFREELQNDGLTIVDVEAVCRSGAVVQEPEPDIRTGCWKYHLEAVTADSSRMAVMFTFVERLNAVMITVFRRSS